MVKGNGIMKSFKDIRENHVLSEANMVIVVPIDYDPFSKKGQSVAMKLLDMETFPMDYSKDRRMALAGEPKKLEKSLKALGKSSDEIKALMKSAVKHTGNEKFVRGKTFKN